MGKLYFTVACARAGKSTYAKNWLVANNYRGVIVNADDIRLALHGKAWVSTAEPIVAGITLTTIRAQLAQDRDVLYDETSTSVNSLKNIFNIDVDAQPIYIDTDVSICIERATKLGQEYLIDPILRMHNNLRHLCYLAKKQEYPDCEISIGDPTKKLVLAGIEVVRENFKRENGYG